MNKNRLKVLAIDDNTDNLTTLHAVMQEALADWTLVTALTGPEGIEQALEEDPDVILLDIVMPGMDGYEVCRRLKANEKLRPIPVIFLTALRTDRDSRIKALDCGAEGFLAKPLDEQELIAEVRAMAKVKAATLMQRDEAIRLNALVEERTYALQQSRESLLKMMEDMQTEIKARKEIEAELRIKGKQYRELFESGSDALLLIVISTGKIIDANQMACVLYGYERDELLAKLGTELSAEPEETCRRMQDALNQPGKVFYIALRLHRKKDGTVFPVEINARAFLQDGEPVLLVSCRDITERKQAEENVKQLNAHLEQTNRDLLNENHERVKAQQAAQTYLERLQIATRTARIGIWDWNVVDNILIWDDTIHDIYGVPHGYFKGGVEEWSTFIHPDDRDRVLQDLQASLRGEGEYAPEFRIIWPDGSLHHIKANSQVFLGENKEPVRMVGSNIDITERKRSEDALRESEKQFRKILDFAPVGAFLDDNDGKAIFINRKCGEIIGVPQQQLYNFDWKPYLHPDDRDRMVSEWEKAFANKTAFRLSYRWVHQDGKIVWTLGEVVPVLDDNGTSSCYIGTLTDITDRKHAEATLEKQNNLLTTLLNNLQIGIYMVEVPSGKPLLANNASFDLLGRGILPESHASTISKVYDLYKSETDEPYPNEELPLVVAMKGVSKHVDDMYVVKPDGTRAALEVYGSPIKDSQGNIWASLVSYQDITERKQAAEAVIQLAQAKNKFIAVVSHELRSPLATIKEATSLVQEGVLGPLTNEQKDMLDIAKSNIDRLGRLVNNVLTYHKMDSCKMLYDLQENDVNEIIQEAYRNATLAAPGRKEDLVLNLVAKPPQTRCDKDKIMQVLLNLISNGIKYSECGPIVIETRLNTREIAFSVRDTGQGIYPEEMETIFMPFSHGRGRKIGGTGLGLAISKEIVLAHNGKIWVESEPGKGSTFYFTLPL